MGFWKFFKRKDVVADCGHKTKIKDKVEAFGEHVIIELPLEGKKTAYCHSCLAEMTIKCAWCGKPIFIGDRVTLYTPCNGKVPDHATVFSKDPLRLVGCSRWDCAETGGDISGSWQPPGKVARRPSLTELVLSTGKMVICNNLQS